MSAKVDDALTVLSMTNRTLLAIDGTNMVHRSYHGMLQTDLRRDDGKPVWALHGFSSALAKFIKEHNATDVVIAFDLPGGCQWRRDLAEGYKAGRGKTDDDLRWQLAAAPKLFEAYGFNVVAESGWEADDLIASATYKGVKAGFNVVVVSSDKDLHQLIDDNVVVYKPEGHVFDIQKIESKYAIHPSRWVEWTAIVGEGADNLPGITGMGPKAAEKLVAAYSDIEDALADELDNVTSVIGKAAANKLFAGAESFRVCRKIGRLETELNVDITVGQLASIDSGHLVSVSESAQLDGSGGRLAAAVSAPGQRRPVRD